ncbi:hypothetical protein CWE27_19835 [Streptomyces sp. EAG2]|nr:hypothetical protein CWE27_19835 [Streptomyces sp. EAG2]
MSAMATQILTLVGVLIGALTSYFATASVERAKFRREMTTAPPSSTSPWWRRSTGCTPRLNRTWP